ncbi:hypothetical protein ACFV3F_33600 [Streptomyces sp. NPDC059717]|uniref:hypothetical protein n=1 Tax=Streptomyces sp. NPDC059717 TaxID=3346922 RepID=UPI0036894518
MAADGKSARGSRHGDTSAAHLLAAMTSDGRTVAQLQMQSKANEITCCAPLWDPFDLAGLVLTADALHTQRVHAVFLVGVKKVRYAFTVKKNRPKLHERLRTLS